MLFDVCPLFSPRLSLSRVYTILISSSTHSKHNVYPFGQNSYYFRTRSLSLYKARMTTITPSPDPSRLYRISVLFCVSLGPSPGFHTGRPRDRRIDQNGTASDLVALSAIFFPFSISIVWSSDKRPKRCSCISLPSSDSRGTANGLMSREIPIGQNFFDAKTEHNIRESSYGRWWWIESDQQKRGEFILLCQGGIFFFLLSFYFIVDLI